MNKVLYRLLSACRLSRFLLLPLAICFLWADQAAAQEIKVNPTGVNVNAQGATSVFLTFGPLSNRFPGEGSWCGELISAAPDAGRKCHPATIFGYLPARFDLSRKSGNRGFTDIMSIPPSVTRRAYQAAEDGEESRFFYVRRFISAAGGRDEYVSVTCRLTGGGARVPFALTDVKLSFEVDKPILVVKPDEMLPPVKAEIIYNGTGRLKGRWEAVLPGDELPTEDDLLTEATLPIEERGLQRRYTQLSSFNVFLPPVGKYILPGPDSLRMPNKVNGPYMLLLRIEATDDKEGDSNLASVKVGPGEVHSGAVAGFPLPVLRYYVGSGPGAESSGTLALLLPDDRAILPLKEAIEFSWTEYLQGAFHQLEIEDLEGKLVASALVSPGTRTYRAPPWVTTKAANGPLRWRVVALDPGGKLISETTWRQFKLLRDKTVEEKN